MALPHPSACIERVFSQVNLVKTKQTNKLLCETVSNRYLAKQTVAKDGGCHKFKPNKSLIDDVREGRCRQRYEKTLEVRNQDSTLSIHAYNLDAEVVEMDAESLTSETFQQ